MRPNCVPFFVQLEGSQVHSAQSQDVRFGSLADSTRQLGMSAFCPKPDLAVRSAERLLSANSGQAEGRHLSARATGR